MAVNTDIATISQNPAFNGPAGSDPVSTGDDAIRYALSFTAKLRDGVGFTPGAIPAAALAYVPVQQGGGGGQGNQKIYIGWNAAGLKLQLQVDATDFGPTWPISISGVAAGATTASTANNATNLGGAAAAEYIRRSTANDIRIGWTGSLMTFSVDGTPFGGTIPMNITGNAGTATTATNSNALGGVAAASFAQRGPGSCVVVEGPRNVGNTGRAIPCTDNRVDRFFISGADLIVDIDGTTYAISKSLPSDARLKDNIAPSTVDSAAEIGALDFVAFDYSDGAGLYQGTGRREVGVIAQQAETIRPAWVKEVQGFKNLDQDALLMSALHAIKQLSDRVTALEG